MNIDEFRDEYMKKFDRPTVPVWKGKPVDELTREELIAALVELYEMCESDGLRYQRKLKFIEETFR